MHQYAVLILVVLMLLLLVGTVLFALSRGRTEHPPASTPPEPPSPSS